MALNLILKTVLIYGQSFIILPIYSSQHHFWSVQPLVCPSQELLSKISFDRPII